MSNNKLKFGKQVLLHMTKLPLHQAQEFCSSESHYISNLLYTV